MAKLKEKGQKDKQKLQHCVNVIFYQKSLKISKRLSEVITRPRTDKAQRPKEKGQKYIQ